ncbi:MAG: hybrid sensor histidine kinase/response regulator [Rhizobacter sp.]|nr:hybrid sensor histidine kinase/response regulator [Rhizobacter sp.]
MRYFLYAVAFLGARQWERAQDWLHRGTHELGDDAPPRAEYVWAQARLWNQAGRSGEALALVQDYLGSGAHAVNGADFPIDTANLLGEAASACERLSDYRAALGYERQAAGAREEAQQRASHARRLTLQIETELDAARRQRDEALGEQHRLAQMNASLQSASDSKMRFLAAASHDLRQPVHALALQTAALKRQLSTARQHEMLATIERCTGSLRTMFDALLDLSQMDAGVLVPQRGPVDVGALLLRLIDEHMPVANAKGLRLALRMSGRGGRVADSDPQLLETALRNLIGNALKYTNRGAVLVTVRRGASPQAGPQWRLQVRDSGIGIAAHDQQHVFDESFQVGNPARRRSRGLGLGLGLCLGLGLAIVRRLCNLLEHPLALRSMQGQGSCFELRLPALDLPSAVPPPDKAEALSLGLHVAVIEDDPDVQAAIGSLLLQWGCRTTTADSADALLAGLAHMPASPPDAVLADFRLPGPRNGAEEVERLRAALGPSIPALILTGDLAADTLRLLERHHLPWLPKPAPVHRLGDWLARAVRSSKHTGPLAR